MAPELSEYYEAQFTMMSHKSWQDFLEDLQRVKGALSDITTATVDTLTNRQGRLAEIEFILTRRETLLKAYTELNEQNDA